MIRVEYPIVYLTIDAIVDVRMTSCDVLVGIGMTSLPVYAHTVCDTRLVKIITIYIEKVLRLCTSRPVWPLGSLKVILPLQFFMLINVV